MPMFSIIVPIHNVEEWLDECVTSILSQSFTDFELIAVDDCSTDNGIAVLRRHAERDARLRILSLERSAGSGQARNAGLEQATGEYVWFIDGDDWIEPGSLQAIAGRARATDADMVVFGWEDRFPDGSRTRTGQQRLLKEVPETFTLAQFPRFVFLLHVVWNKVVRRDLIDRHQYRFEVGQYQDLDFTYLMLSAAGKISVLDHICVNYRQRGTSVTKTSSDKHFAVFDQYERTFDLIKRQGLFSASVHGHLFTKMLRHLQWIYYKTPRIPKASRRRFVATTRRLYRKHRPERRAHPITRSERLNHALIAFAPYAVLEARRALRHARNKGIRPIKL